MNENTVRTKSFKGLSKLKTIIKDIYSKKKTNKETSSFTTIGTDYKEEFFKRLHLSLQPYN